MCTCCVQLPVAVYIMWSPDFSANRLYSNTTLSTALTTISSGYFLYDLYVCLFRYEGAAYLLHGAVCFALYSYTACTGFLHYYGVSVGYHEGLGGVCSFGRPSKCLSR